MAENCVCVLTESNGGRKGSICCASDHHSARLLVTCLSVFHRHHQSLIMYHYSQLALPLSLASPIRHMVHSPPQLRLFPSLSLSSDVQGSVLLASAVRALCRIRASNIPSAGKLLHPQFNLPLLCVFRQLYSPCGSENRKGERAGTKPLLPPGNLISRLFFHSFVLLPVRLWAPVVEPGEQAHVPHDAAAQSEEGS